VANPGVGKPAGAISQLDVENSLRFNNGLMVFDTTAQGLLNILNSPNAENKSNGGFIQIGGVRFSYDPSKPVGSRVQDVVLVNEAGQITARIADNGVVLAGAPSLIQGIVLNFTANGGDNYAFKANATNFRFVKTDGTLSAAVDPALDFTSATTIATYTGSATGLLGEQAVLETYLSTKFATPATAFNLADTPEAQDIRIQNQAARTDTVLVGDYLLGPATSNFAENGSGVVYVAATTGLNGAATSYSVSGPDAARFQIDATTGALTFAASPDFERPTDQGLNNIYELTLVASDGASTATQKLSITVTDVLDTASYTGTAGPNTFTANSAFDWTISGLAGNDVLTGNVGKDTIYGGAGQDVLDGGQGADLLLGGLGGDTYIVDNSGDQVVELAGEGADLVKASVSYTLSANVENLDLTGGDPINAVGNELANVINGNNGDNVLAGFQGNDTLRGGAGNDTLAGGPGADTLTGGPGSDRFVFDSLETSQKRDLITDFAAGEDKIVLSSDAFTGLTGAGALTADQFGVGAKATTAAQRVIYNPVTGALSYDADGKGAGAAVVVAVLTGRPSIGASDIEVHPSAGLTPSINLMAQAAASFGGGAEVFVGSGLSNDNASRPQLLNLASRA
jgi:Ca2+-binding RTX toxin-like protein